MTLGESKEIFDTYLQKKKEEKEREEREISERARAQR
jgi:hypothetical protein